MIKKSSEILTVGISTFVVGSLLSYSMYHELDYAVSSGIVFGLITSTVAFLLHK